MAKFKPYWITSSQDSSLSIVPGQFVVHTDTGEAFVDIDNNTRKSISGGSSSEIETNLTEAQIKALTSHPKAIYIASDTHGIWYYDNGWVNLDTDTHQNAFGKIKVGNVDMEAESPEDTLTLVEGSNIALTPNVTNDSVTISATGVATAAQGEKADSAVQNITINGSSAGISKSNNKVDLPAYPTTLPASDTTDTYSSSGTTPVSGKAVAAALGTLKVTGDSNISASKTIKSWTETNGKISIGTQNISITHDQVSDAGDAITKNSTTTISENNDALITSGAVYAAISNLPKPMVMRGTLGAIADGGKIQELPATSSAAVGDTYKVVTAGTYALQTAKVGDLFTLIEKNNTKSWLYIPSGDDIEDTHRVVKLNETEILGNNSVPLNLKNGNFVNITSSQNATTGNMDVTVAHSDTSSQSSVSNSGRTYIQSVTLDSAGHVTGLSSATETVTNTDTYVNNASFAHDNNNNNIKMTLTRNDNNTVKANIPKISSSTSGVVPKGNSVSSQSQSTKFLREDGTWAAPSYTTYSTATQSANGLMSSADKKKLDGVATGATANVGTVTKVSTGSGLTGGDITTSGSIKANLKSETASTLTAADKGTTENREYAVGIDANGKLSVNIPWLDKRSQFINITDDFNSGVFSNNLDNYNTGNYILKTYNDVTYAAVLAHYDYYYGYNPKYSAYSANVLEHHWVAVVLGFEAGQMNTSSSTLGGFKNSAMNSWLKNSCKTALQGAFGSNHLITHSLFLSKGTYDSNVFSYSDGTLKTERISGVNGFNMEWEHGIVAMLMSEEQIFGTSCFDFKGISTYDACRPLKLFQDKSYMEVLGHDFGQSNNTFNESTGHSCWLRNISRIGPGKYFCSASKLGTAGYDNAANTFGRFPIVLLK